eukprot:8336388-Pyramimonas_sp.AAC.1
MRFPDAGSAAGGGSKAVDSEKNAHFCCPHPRKLVRSALRLHFAAPPQTCAEGLWLHRPKVSAGDHFEIDFAAGRLSARRPRCLPGRSGRRRGWRGSMTPLDLSAARHSEARRRLSSARQKEHIQYIRNGPELLVEHLLEFARENEAQWAGAKYWGQELETDQSYESCSVIPNQERLSTCCEKSRVDLAVLDPARVEADDRWIHYAEWGFKKHRAANPQPAGGDDEGAGQVTEAPHDCVEGAHDD